MGFYQDEAANVQLHWRRLPKANQRPTEGIIPGAERRTITAIPDTRTKPAPPLGVHQRATNTRKGDDITLSYVVLQVQILVLFPAE